jgi:hypothetical protein
VNKIAQIDEHRGREQKETILLYFHTTTDEEALQYNWENTVRSDG